jgi:hypothetical protein
VISSWASLWNNIINCRNKIAFFSQETELLDEKFTSQSQGETMEHWKFSFHMKLISRNCCHDSIFSSYIEDNRKYSSTQLIWKIFFRKASFLYKFFRNLSIQCLKNKISKKCDVIFEWFVIFYRFNLPEPRVSLFKWLTREWRQTVKWLRKFRSPSIDSVSLCLFWKVWRVSIVCLFDWKPQ